MRTPWKMFADLVSGKSSKDETETDLQTQANEDKPAGLETARTAEADEIAPAHAELAITPEAEVAPEPDEVTRPAVIDASQAEMETITPSGSVTINNDEEVASSSAINETSDSTVTRLPIAEAPAPVKAKRIIAKRRQKSITAPAVEPPQDARPAPKSPLDEMADLNRDIDDLRQRLAEKLRLQNAQLRKLIDRYEGR